MYILALFQYGCPRMFFCFPLGPKIKSGSISKEMLRHVYTRGSIGFRNWFPISKGDAEACIHKRFYRI